jgi:hypothetical protein
MGAIAKRDLGIAFLMLWVIECDRFSDVVGYGCDRFSDVVGYGCDRISGVVGFESDRLKKIV